MSFKDDFFEALRSVKKDFLRDSSGAEQEPPPQREAAQPPQREQPVPGPFLEDTGEFRMPDNIITADDETPAASARSDQEVMDAFRQASAIDDDGFDDADDGYADMPEVYTPNAGNRDSAPPYREYDPGYSNNSAVPANGDGRRVFDFDADSVYSDDRTVISKNTVIRGALQTDDSLRMMGQILGDIECKSNIVIAGKVRGNTSAANAYIIDAQIDGNMYCDDAINVNKDAWVLGNIRAQHAEIDGKVKGNIEIRHNVSIGSASSVIGNISTDELEIKRGAFVNGQIIMYSPSRDVIDRFDDFERI
jgi:cytoskeletal protein CcmA (bactofilin family)